MRLVQHDVVVKDPRAGICPLILFQEGSVAICAIYPTVAWYSEGSNIYVLRHTSNFSINVPESTLSTQIVNNLVLF
jgi:hypothetical protein